jgi:hypothetical protein
VNGVPEPGDRVRVTLADGAVMESTVRHAGSAEYSYSGPFDGWEEVDNGHANLEVLPPARCPHGSRFGGD